MIRLGANYRALYSPLLAGVTGSVGKTTTKEFCYAVFSAFGKTLRTEGNQNNEIGMPNTLFRLDESIEVRRGGDGHAGPGRDPEADAGGKALRALSSPASGVSHIWSSWAHGKISSGQSWRSARGLPQGAPLVVNGDDDLSARRRAIRPDLEKVLFAVGNAGSRTCRALRYRYRGGGHAVHHRATTAARKPAPRISRPWACTMCCNAPGRLMRWPRAWALHPAAAAAALAGYHTHGPRASMWWSTAA